MCVCVYVCLSVRVCDFIVCVSVQTLDIFYFAPLHCHDFDSYRGITLAVLSPNHILSRQGHDRVIPFVLRLAEHTRIHTHTHRNTHTPPQCSLTLGILLALPLATSNYKGFASKTELVVLHSHITLVHFHMTFYREF